MTQDMSKRNWDPAMHSPASTASSYIVQNTFSPAHSDSVASASKKVRIASSGSKSPSDGNAGTTRPDVGSNNDGDDRRLPTISRKVKACAACRKQKIKCKMPGGPPCERCKERGLSCRLNKSLQTLMSEDSKWKASVTKDLTTVYSSLDHVLQRMSLPALPSLQTSTQDPAIFFDKNENPNDPDEDEQSPDNSPKVSPANEDLSHVPIESLYQITGLRALRPPESATDEQERICKQLRDSDFIARGLISTEDGEYLANFYMTRLDPYIWHLAGAYKDLDSFRRTSPTLTAACLSVAALHDTTRPHLYPICVKEYRKLVANAMFERRIDLEYIRGLVIGAMWLSDISWTLSGYAIRRASEFNLSQYYYQVVDSHKDPENYTPEQLEKAMDGVRVMYLLYLLDHHLSLLFGRSSIMRDNENYITGWEAYLTCPISTDADKRIASQVTLACLMNQIRERFGTEGAASMLPVSCVSKIASFEHELDNWASRHTYQNPNKHIGNWPTKGVIFNYRFAKLYLDSYVFRGLTGSNSIIPEPFIKTASAAVAAATSIVDSLLEDEIAQKGLTGVPHYFHGMVAFACMFLLKVATRHSEQLFVNVPKLEAKIGALSHQLKVTPVGKDHLIHKMADGLAKLAQMLRTKIHKTDETTKAVLLPIDTDPAEIHKHAFGGRDSRYQQHCVGMDPFDSNSLAFGDPNFGLGMPFFDFEGTNLGLEEALYAIA